MLSAMNANTKQQKKIEQFKSNDIPIDQIEKALSGTQYDGKTIVNQPSDEKKHDSTWNETLPTKRIVRVKRVIIDPYDVHTADTTTNKRAHYSSIQKLAALIKDSDGNTVTVGIQFAKEGASHDKKYEIIWGKRRTMATSMANCKLKADLYLDPITDVECRLLAGMENAGRKDPNYFEKADIYNDLIKDGFEKKSLAKAEETSRQQLDKLLQASFFPHDLREKLNDIHKVIRSTAIELGRLFVLLKQRNVERYESLYSEFKKQHTLDASEVLAILQKETKVDSTGPIKQKFDVGMDTGEQAVCVVESKIKQTGISITLKKKYSEVQLVDVQNRLKEFIKSL